MTVVSVCLSSDALSELLTAGASRQSRSGPENVHDAAEKKYYSKDGVERVRHGRGRRPGLCPARHQAADELDNKV